MLHEPAVIWQSCLAVLKKELPSQSLQTWIEPLRIQHIDPNQIVIIAPDAFFCDWVEEHYQSCIEQAIFETTSWRPAFSILPGSAPSASVSGPTGRDSKENAVIRPVSSFALNTRYRFDNFIAGESNEFAFSASKAVAEAPGKTSFNPFVIYSGVGLGKTHLLQAIGNYCLEEGTVSNVVYITAEKFISDYIRSIRKREMESFVSTYRSADILLVDDIQFFLKTEGSQREFFHTFNVLFQNDKQIVLSADCAPPSLKGFAPRLISRFQSGLVASIDSPDLETRIAIINHKVERQGIDLQADVVQQIAEANVSNVRELEGALTRVFALSKLTDKSITSDLVSKMLPNIRSECRKPTIDDILNVTTRHFELASIDIQGKTRKQEVVLARHVTMYLSKKLTGLSLKMIGANLGDRDHSTVVHACRNVEKRMKNDPDFFDLIARLYGHLGHTFHIAA